MLSSGKKIAAESQLLNEERWIVNALKKIRTQRNCLQIERLQLESMLAHLKCGTTSKDIEKSDIVSQKPIENYEAVTTELLALCSTNANKLDMMSPQLSQDSCNFEELNLNVSDPVFYTSNPSLGMDICSEEEDEDSEQEDGVIIDMNMFMNAEGANDG